MGELPANLPTFAPGAKVTATFDTSLGKFVCELYVQDCPITVGNFVGLATGEIGWSDPRGNPVNDRPLYSGTVFHRVIKGFMVQGGDPAGTGRGGPGWRFKDEIVPRLKHDRPGILSMANAGPGTNGSQFFLTEVPTPHLDGRHTVFGAVIEGLDVVKKICATPCDNQDRPREPVVIKSIAIAR